MGYDFVTFGQYFGLLLSALLAASFRTCIWTLAVGQTRGTSAGTFGQLVGGTSGCVTLSLLTLRFYCYRDAAYVLLSTPLLLRCLTALTSLR